MKQENMLQTFEQGFIEDIMKTRTAQLDIYTAAFLKQVGSKEASKYTLVEKRSEDWRTTTWTFKLKEELE